MSRPIAYLRHATVLANRSAHLSGNSATRGHCNKAGNDVAGASRLPRVTLYTGTDCSLCDVVKELLQQLKNEGVAFDLETYNIRDDSLADVHRWRRAYQYDIPVIHLNGKEIARHRLSRAQLLAALENVKRSVEDSSNG